jgi:hypothetical protein
MALKLWSKYLQIPESNVLDYLAQINDYYPYYLIKMIKKEYFSTKINNQDIIITTIQKLLNDPISKGKSKLFNLKDLSTLGINLARLNLSNQLHNLLDYNTDDYELDFNLNINTIQKRVKKFSYGLINEKFPFSPYNYMIGGGFVLNSITGITSKYTDIDIYIFKNFKNSIMELIDYFKSICNIKITYNKSIINIYPIDYKISIQIINVDGYTPEKIITDFDLSYSQFALLNWNLIKMTFPAYKTLITGCFNINRNAIIRNYRIIKGYIKGFKLEQEINTNNEEIYQYNLLNEVKNLIEKLNDNFNSNTEIVDKILLSYLITDDGNNHNNQNNDYKLLTKNIYLSSQEHIDILKDEESIKTYLENVTGYKYISTIESIINNMEPINTFIDYEISFDLITESTKTIKPTNTKKNYFPLIKDIQYVEHNNYLNIKTINDDILLYKLYVDSGSYYKNYKPLNYFKLNLNCKKMELKIISFTDNLIKFEIPFNGNTDLVEIIKGLDYKIKCLGEKITKSNNFKQSTLRNDSLILVTSPSIFLKNLVYTDKSKKNILSYNRDLKQLKKTINSLFAKDKTQFITLDSIKNINNIDSIDILGIDESNNTLSIKVCIEGIIYNKKFNYYTYQFKIISINS